MLPCEYVSPQSPLAVESGMRRLNSLPYTLFVTNGETQESLEDNSPDLSYAEGTPKVMPHIYSCGKQNRYKEQNNTT